MKNKNGFTLVELLAVIVLISLIMVIVVPQVQKVAYQSKVKLCKSKIELAESALNLWAQDNYGCFFKDGGCNMLDNCDYEEDKITCTVTFEKLAKNNIVNFDQKINDSDTIINPINNSSLNNIKFRIRYNKNSKTVSNENEGKDETIKIDKICK